MKFSDFDYKTIANWHSLGSFISSREWRNILRGHGFMVNTGDIVLSQQVADSGDEAMIVAVVLHEYGHKACGHTGLYSAEVYSAKEAEASMWAANILLNGLQDVDDKITNRAFDILAKDF